MSEVGEWGDNRARAREGEEKKAGRSIVQIHGSLPFESKGGGGRCQLSCKVREYVNTETVTMVMLASYESSHCCAGVVTC